MTERNRIQAPVRARRSHAERTAETRARVMAAVVESIAEVGYQKTTASEIAVFQGNMVAIDYDLAVGLNTLHQEVGTADADSRMPIEMRRFRKSLVAWVRIVTTHARPRLDDDLLALVGADHFLFVRCSACLE